MSVQPREAPTVFRAHDIASQVYTKGKAAATLKETHFDLAQAYKAVLRSERKQAKTVALLKAEVEVRCGAGRSLPLCGRAFALPKTTLASR
jgi:hypothetical protein